MKRLTAAILFVCFVIGCSNPAPMDADSGLSDLDGGRPAPTVDAAAVERCDTPGTVETVPCERCGTVDRFCSAERTWAYGVCTPGDGVCEPGTTRRADCGQCGTQLELCTTSCEWEVTGTCSDEGECTPGTRVRMQADCNAGEQRDLLCNDACGFDPTSECESDRCPTPGVSERVACGNCGTRARFCTAANEWSYEACESEGECLPGTRETRVCGQCGNQAALCNVSCEWELGSACRDERECAAGASSPCMTACGSVGTSVCSASCEPGACTPPLEACNGADDDCDRQVDEAPCADTCTEAAATRSSLGCEFWPVAMANAVDRAVFGFSLALVNPGTSAADVTVRRGGATVATATVAAGGAANITLPWVDELQNSTASTLVRNGAYQVTSTQAIAVYQFAPLEYVSGEMFAFTSDASLVLPSHALTGNYVVAGWPAMLTETVNRILGTELPQRQNSPALVTLTSAAAAENRVQITFAGHVVASTDNTVRAFRRGETGTFALRQGDVLQLVSEVPPTCVRAGMTGNMTSTTYFCRVGSEYDLTGTEIQATGSLSVISGHVCARVPFDRQACDHLEEVLLPRETWGRELPVALPRSTRSEPNIIRIVSGSDGNQLTFEPLSVHPPVTLGRGGLFELESRTDFVVRSSQGAQVIQFLSGEHYSASDASGQGGLGDPSMMNAMPREQYRRSFTVSVPTSFTSNWVGIIAPVGSSVTLDGRPLSGFSRIGGSDFQSTNLQVAPGAHVIAGDRPIGVTSYGYANYTSYAVSAGGTLMRLRTVP